MSEVVLKPCPFCGEVPEVERVASGYRGDADAATAKFRVQCECCGIRFERQTEVAIDDDGKVKVLCGRVGFPNAEKGREKNKLAKG